jgi:hypothetical protein
MVTFAIIELDDGLTIATVQPGQTPEEAAAIERGALIDATAYESYEDAYDALCELESEDEEELRA